MAFKHSHIFLSFVLLIVATLTLGYVVNQSVNSSVSVITQGDQTASAAPAQFQVQAAISVPTSGLVHHWTLDGNGGDSTGGNTLIVSGASYVSGIIGQALSFNGSSNSARTSANIGTNSNIVSVAFWLNWNSYSNNDALAMELSSNYNSTNDTFLVDPNSSAGGGGQFEVSIQSGGYKYRTQLFSRPSAGVWHNYAIVFDNSTAAGNITVYVDGSAQATNINSNTKTGNSGFGGQPIYFMSRGGSSLYGAGMLDDVYVYGRALTSSEASQIYSIGQNTTTTTTSNTQTAPVISSVSVSGITVSGATINWTTDQATNSQVEYGLTSVYGSNSALNGAYSTSHSVALSGLSAGTVYHYRIDSTNSTGQMAQSGDYTFTTSAASQNPIQPLPDTTAPSAPTGFSVVTANTTSSSISLVWNSSTDPTVSGYVTSGLAGYRIYRGGVYIGYTTGTTFMDTALSPASIYSYAIAAYDNAGNLSAKTVTISVTTLAATQVKTQQVVKLGNTPVPGDLWTQLDTSGIDRAINWSKAGVTQSINGGVNNGPQGIPSGNWNVYQTLSASGGDDTTVIQNAMNNAPANSVIQLNPGTYHMNEGLRVHNSNVALRGSGPGKTNLIASDYINFSPYGTGTGATLSFINWTGGFAKGTTQITLSGVSGLNVGDEVMLTQYNPAVVISGNNDWVGGWPQAFANCFSQENSSAPNAQNCQIHMAMITAINGNNITIDAPLYTDFNSSYNTKLAYWPYKMHYSGIENLTIFDQGYSATAGSIWMSYCGNCWIKGVEVTGSHRSSVTLQFGYKDEIRDSYFHDVAIEGNGSWNFGYGLESDNVSAMRIENNMLLGLGIGFETPVTESVIGYNYIVAPVELNSSGYANPGWAFGSIDPHYPQAAQNLIEGNYGLKYIEENVWGSGDHQVLFRNRFTGAQAANYFEPKATNSITTVELQYGHRYENVIGNVLGTQASLVGGDGQSRYEWYDTLGCDNSSGVYTLAYWYDCYDFQTSREPASQTYDPLVYSTLLRWGNWDAVTGSVSWNAGEVPSDIMTVLGGPPTNTLPSSLYLSVKPAWWGSEPWPAIGPDVTGATGATGDPNSGGHAYNTPAIQCYVNESLATNSSVNGSQFNPTTCYPGDFGSGVGGDSTPPTVNTFTVTSPVTTLTVPVTSFTATDNTGGSGVNGYEITVSSTAPSSTDPNWTSTAPTSYVLSSGTGSGTYTLYAWAMDASYNISTSKTASVVVNLPLSAPTITTQPIGQTASAGSTASFSVAATGNPATFTYQWQSSTNSGSTWTNISGATSATYTTGTLVLGNSGTQYRVIVTNSQGSATSNAATITVVTFNQNPIAMYGFENASSLGTDSTGAHNGTVYGSPTKVTGKVGTGAISLNGTNQYISIGNVNASPVSISLWVNLTASQTQGDGWGSLAMKAYTFGMEVNGTTAYWEVGNGSYPWNAQETTSLTVGQWTHLVGVYDGTNVTLYKNGVLIGTKAGTLTATANGMYIGSWDGTQEYLNGGLDDVEIYSRALSQSDVTALYGMGSGGTSTTPPTPPTLSSTGNTSSSASLSWTASTAGTNPIAGYHIYRADISTNSGLLATVGSGVTTYTDTGLTASTQYTYTVAAYDNASPANQSSLSNIVNVTTQVNQFALTVAKTGSGTITSSPAGINCGSTCSASYNSGASVTLTAVSSGGYAFSGWSGTCTNTSGTCAVTMSQAQNVTANFLANSTTFSLNQQVQVTSAVGSSGLSVRSTPAGTAVTGSPEAIGSIGTVISGTPQYAYLSGTGYWWWDISYADGTSGWSAEGVSGTPYLSVYTAPATYTINASAGAGGTINPSGAVTVASGNNQTFTITPNLNYQVSSVTVDGSAVTIPAAGGTYTFSNVTAGHNIVANFSSITLPAYTIGGTITGLNGTLVLQDNSGDNLSKTSSGSSVSFTFATALTSNSGYTVTVLTQPATQTCSVTNGSGTVVSANISNVNVTCTTGTDSTAPTVNTFAVSPTSQSSLTVTGISITASDPTVSGQTTSGVAGYMITESATPAPTASTNGWSSSVPTTFTVSSAGSNKTLYAWAKDGAGNVSPAKASNQFTVTLPTYSIIANVSGLSGTLVLQDNGGDNLSVTTNGSYTFATKIGSGGVYSVTVYQNPTTQTCTVTGANGSVGSGNVNVAVTCVTGTDVTAPTVSFSVGSNQTSLTVPITTFTATDPTVANHVTSGVTGYAITTTNTAPLANATGVWSSAAPTTYTFASAGAKTLYAWAKDGAGNVSIVQSATFTITLQTYTIGGTISGLSGTLVLQDNGGDNITITSPASSFTFPTKIANGNTYAVTILTQPSTQTCSVTNGSGNVGSANISNVGITCSVNPDLTAPSTPANFAVGSVTWSAVSLSWSASTDPTVSGQTTSGVAGYRIFRCTGSSCSPVSQIGTSLTTLYTDSTVAAATTYRYSISAYDNASPANTSISSAPITVNVPSAVVTYNFTLNATSNGTIKCSVNGGAGGTCPTTVNSNANSIVLTSTPDSGFSTTWSSNCVVTGNPNSCSITVIGDTTVAVSFADIQGPSVSVTAPANNASVSGTVNISASAYDNVGVAGLQFKIDGNNLGPFINAPYSVLWDSNQVSNGQHTISAVANDSAGNSTISTAITVTVSNSVSANTANLTVSAAGNGSGTVTSSNSVINCGSGGSVCTDNVTLGAPVTLHAAAGSNSSFSGWSGGCTNTSGDCVLSMNSDTYVTANFTLNNTVITTTGGGGGGGGSYIQTYTLTVTKQGLGLGLATSTPPGITCGTLGYACTLSFSSGSGIILNAVAQSGSHLAFWTGCDSIATSSCKIAMIGNKTVSVDFELGAATTTVTNTVTNPTNGVIPGCPLGFTCILNSGGGTVGGNTGGELTSATTTALITKYLYYGSTDPQVIILQELLNGNGYPVATSGAGSLGHEIAKFGPATTAALERFQCAKAIVCSGTTAKTGYGATGPSTRDALNNLPNRPGTIVSNISNCPVGLICTPTTGSTGGVQSSYQFTRSLGIGSTGSDVQQLQIFLNGHGFTVAAHGNGSTGNETTYYGPATASAVSRFQVAHAAQVLAPYGLTQGTGYFGPSTMAAVNAIIALGQ